MMHQPSVLSAQQGTFDLPSIMSYPFPTGLTTAETGTRMAWALNESGLRNVYVAEGPEFKARRLTGYLKDDGQAISSLSISKNGKWLVYIRGGDFGSNWDDAKTVNPTFAPQPPKVEIWSFAFDGTEPILLGEGESPEISPLEDQVAFVNAGQIWTVPIDGSEKATKLFNARGSNGSPTWSPDGTKLAFRSNRSDHSFIGVYVNQETPIVWLNPSFHRDYSPKWSPDGNHIAFVRQSGSGGSPDSILAGRHIPWQIMRADVSTGDARKLWEAPKTLRGSPPTTHGRTNLNWGMGHIFYLSYEDGWPHLYSIPENGGSPKLLTPGNFMAEYIKMSPDKKSLVFCGNTGPDQFDIDRRHIIQVSIDNSDMKVLTPGYGNEWTPSVMGNGKSIAYISAGSQSPPIVAILESSKKTKELTTHLIPSDFPTPKLVVPKQVTFKAADGTTIHGTLFNQSGNVGKKPAIVYVHGGPPRQMLLGWHYSSYYSNAYAVNQYLANQGYTVLSVNYRLGIGYGYEFHRPIDGGTRGASEYQDVKAAGEWLAKQSFVDADRIGIYGGSYGGYLTAMALGRDSDLFAAGVDIHGVHDRAGRSRSRIFPDDEYERAPDADRALDVAWESSPVSSIDTWTSPVMIIHADDDRNVAFSQSTDLVQRLEKQGVTMETMVIVDDTHHFMLHANQQKVNEAIAGFLKKYLKKDKT